MATTNYAQIISKTIQTMIVSQQRVFLSTEIGQLIRSQNSSLSNSQVVTAIRKLKADKRIKVTKVSKTKQYISYQGIC